MYSKGNLRPAVLETAHGAVNAFMDQKGEKQTKIQRMV